jgi:hypothetical protein
MLVIALQRVGGACLRQTTKHCLKWASHKLVCGSHEQPQVREIWRELG